MGLPRAAIHLLIHEAATSPWRGRIGTLGRQHVYATLDEIKALAKNLPAATHAAYQDAAYQDAAYQGGASQGGVFHDIVPKLHRDPVLRDAGYLSDDSLFEFLGFEQSVRMDRSDYEGAEERLDLNSAETPLHLRDSFDLILDSGTIEHIFEIGRAMQHCLQMAKVGGRIIHLTPTSNAVNHGFYSVSPALFADFYRANGCEIEKLWLCRMKGDFVRGAWDVYDCLSTNRNWLPLGRLDGALWLTYAVIRKVTSVPPQTPQQSFYVDTWQSSTDDSKVSENESIPEKQGQAFGKAERILLATKKWKTIHRVANRGIIAWRAWVNSKRERNQGRVPYRYVGRF
ncbi:MAG: class I SAM-dependent methyltransferase [Pirellula sp.]|jgi:SAM-dependent methyltransferase|nr:class I SAM-dependent methyltransferase [Pirellula sp.]